MNALVMDLLRVQIRLYKQLYVEDAVNLPLFFIAFTG